MADRAAWTRAVTAREVREGLAQLNRQPSKYRSRKTVLGDLTFDSAKEARVWASLQLRERAGEIRGLKRQVRYRLMVNGCHVCSYVSDFVWTEAGRVTVADCKSAMTRKLREYRIKAKLFAALTGRPIVEL